MSSTELILPQNAIVLPKQLSETSLMTYVKSVSSIIGSSNVLAVFDNGCNVKLYLKSEKHVRLLVNQGLVLHGLFSIAEYAVSRGDKVILSNVDPIIPDDELVNLLSSYGTLESELMYKKPFTECEYSHIKSDVRYVYMNIFDIENFPSKLDWMLNDIWYEIHVAVEKENKVSSLINCMRINKLDCPQNSILPLRNIRNDDVSPLTNHSSNSLKSPENVILQRKKVLKSLNRASYPVTSSGSGETSMDLLQDSVSTNDSVSDSTPKTSRNMKLKTTLKSKSVSDLKSKRMCNLMNPGRVHHNRLRKILRSIPLEKQSRYPMGEKDLRAFFKKTYKNRNKLAVVFSMLNKNDKDTLERFKCQLMDVSIYMKSVPLTARINLIIKEIDAYLANQQE